MKMKAVYLTPASEGKWFSGISEMEPPLDSIYFVGEQAYPVELSYARTDMNGSVCYEGVTCENRDALIETLNWLGACRWTPVALWDFDIEASENGPLLDLFNKASEKRMELCKAEAEAMYEAFSGPEELALTNFPQGKDALSVQIQSAAARRTSDAQAGTKKSKAPEFPF